jgi:hypothetical protein
MKEKIAYFKSWRLRMGCCIVGRVYDHSNPRFWDGKKIETTPVNSLEGNIATTDSGSKYRLNEECVGSMNALKNVLGLLKT